MKKLKVLFEQGMIPQDKRTLTESKKEKSESENLSNFAEFYKKVCLNQK